MSGFTSGLTFPLAERGAKVLDTLAAAGASKTAAFAALQAAGLTAASLTALATGAGATMIALPRGGDSADDRVRKAPASLMWTVEVGIYALATAGTLSFDLGLYGWGDYAGLGTSAKRWYHIANLNGGNSFTAANNPGEFHGSDLECSTVCQVEVAGVAEYFAVLCTAISGTNARVRAGLRQGVL